MSSTSTRPYSLHIGELALLDGGRPAHPARPKGFAVDAVHRDGDTAEVFLSWRLADSGVWYYDVLRELPDGGRESVGRIYDDVYYVKSLARAGSEASSVLHLVAVAPDGAVSGAASAQVRWG